MTTGPIAKRSRTAEFGELEELHARLATPFSREDFSTSGLFDAIILSEGLLQQLDHAAGQATIAQWLKTLPCPVIGLAGASLAAQEVCDVIVETDADLEAVLANIDRAPIAAMILVQVLRMTSGAGIWEGLTLESLAYGTLQKGREHDVWLASRDRAAPSAISTPEPPILMDRSGDSLTMQLNRPDRLNAVSVEMRDALCEALQLILSDSTIGAVTMSGRGRCFSIGGDLEEFGAAPDPATAHGIRSVRLPAFYLSQCADRVAFRLHGACIGAGIELPAFGHRVAAARNSFFQLPEIRFGLIPGAGGCVSLPRRIGRQRTAWLALSGRRISALKALEWGLVDEIEG